MEAPDGSNSLMSRWKTFVNIDKVSQSVNTPNVMTSIVYDTDFLPSESLSKYHCILTLRLISDNPNDNTDCYTQNKGATNPQSLFPPLSASVPKFFIGLK